MNQKANGLDPIDVLIAVVIGVVVGLGAMAWGGGELARLAAAKDLRALLIRRPEADRLVLGRFGRWLVATEASPSSRVSARGAVALVGPTRSGKTTTLTGAILDWEGPAVLVSVKTDLLVDTHFARARRGPTHVFDPAGVTGRVDACWSPLAAAKTTAGAIKAAACLVEAAPRTGRVEGSEFWMQMAESLMAALLLVAANADQPFSEVVGWVVSLDMPSEASPGKVAPLYRALREDADPLRRAAGVFAADVLEGLWRNDHRTISSVYATARTLVWPWADPIVAASAKDKPFDPADLVDESATLYVRVPQSDQNRLRPVLGGVLNYVVAGAYARYLRTGRPLDPPLLLVIDEAATLRPDQLPSWASTLAGIGVQLVTAWQSVSQIDAAYARDAQAILTNHLTKLFFPGMNDGSGLDYVSRLVGDEHVPARLSRDERPVGGRGETPVTTLALVPPAVLRQMRRGDAVMIHGSLPPAHIHPRPWYSDRRLSALAGLQRPGRWPRLSLPGGSRVAGSPRSPRGLRSGSRPGRRPAP